MTHWKEYRIKDIGKVKNGFAFKSKDFTEHGVPIIKIKNVKPGNINFNELSFVSPTVAAKAEKFRIQKNDILITMSGNRIDGSPDTWVGKVAMFKKEGHYLLNQRVGIIELNSKEINPDFLTYVLSSYQYQHHFINKANSSGGQANISPEIIHQTRFFAPDLPTQTAIAEILSSLDDKIELNNQINQNLEALAQAIFKRWFVDFEFPNESGQPYKSSGGEMVESELGEIPKGWSPIPIGQLFESVIGGDWGQEQPDLEHTEMCYVIRGTDIPVLESGYSSGVPFRAIRPSKASQRLLNEGDIVIEISGGSKDQPTGRSILITAEILKRLEPQSIPASFCRKVRPKAGFSEFLAAHLTKIYSEGKTWTYQNQSTGISNFQFKYFEKAELIPLPPNHDVVHDFARLMKNVFSLMTSNESMQLASLRDALIPKLISGELEVRTNKMQLASR